jgi:phosphohistidine phosphatase
MDKQLVTLVRHAKSDWDDRRLSDHDRPLNERGRRDGPVMAQRLLDRGCIPDLILCSTAKRAQQTTACLMDAFQLTAGQLVLDRELYLSSPRTILGLLAGVALDIRHAMVVAHNPGLEDLCELLAGHPMRPMPTLGVRQYSCNAIRELAAAVTEQHMPEGSGRHSSPSGQGSQHPAPGASPGTRSGGNSGGTELVFEDYPKSPGHD